MSNLRPSGYENGLTSFCNLVKSRVLASISIKIGEMNFRTLVSFFELFGEIFPQLFSKWFNTSVRSFLNKMGNLKFIFGGFENE